MTKSVAARVAALPKTPTPELRQMWRELFDKEPPGFSRSYLISRLELSNPRAGLRRAQARDPRQARCAGRRARSEGGSEACDERAGGRDAARSACGAAPRHRVQVLADGFEWEGRRYKSLSAVARAISGTRWNGWTFFGLKKYEIMTRAAQVIKRRCAIYTRKSHEEGLEQEFNSLHAQREAGLAYIASQKNEGWIALPDRYDDGGISGATLQRPALKRLLRDVEAGLIDVIVTYKLDRLSRSLTDFVKLIELFERHNVTFVSVTQQFNTTSSMGRLTLNVLLSFAQFERELTGERIRDKFLQSRKRGLWMGGWPPLGYEVEDRRLVVVEREAAVVRRIFDRFAKTGSALTVARELNAGGEVTKRRLAPAVPRRQALDQRRRLQGAGEPSLPRRSGASRRRVSRRTRGDHRPARLG